MRSRWSASRTLCVECAPHIQQGARHADLDKLEPTAPALELGQAETALHVESALPAHRSRAWQKKLILIPLGVALIAVIIVAVLEVVLVAQR